MTAASSYYYDQLPKEEKAAYYAITSGLKNLDTSFAVPRLEPLRIAELYFLVRMDHPELFYSVRYHWRYYPQADHIELLPDYLFPKAKCIEHRTAMNSRVRKLILQAQEQKTIEEKLLFLHDFLSENVTYDKLKKAYSHEIIGALGNGTAVCEGIAKAFKILCDGLGIWCIVVLSENAPEKGIRYRHAWNLVKIEGKYYHIDATFDNTISRSTCLRHDYFLLEDRWIFRDHEPSIYPIPASNDPGKMYYLTKKLSFTKKEDVEKRAAQAVKKKKALLFHWRGGYLTRQVLAELITILQEEGKKRQKEAWISVNWPQSVIYTDYREISQEDEYSAEERIFEENRRPKEDYILEQANEGELYEESSI